MTDRLVHQGWISLGSNLGDRAAQLAQARSQMATSCGKILRISGIYESSAWGFESDHRFFNQCLQMTTGLSPESLMRKLVGIEKQMGRHRTGNGYADRPIDLDILFFDDLIIQTDPLQVPHPRLADRRFVLQPLYEIAADKKDPVTGRTVGEMLERCPDPSRVEKIIP
jgi:2-amino-4-hydroxy-6-hydroxymethyldihydropteridine diphosphokinase